MRAEIDYLRLMFFFQNTNLQIQKSFFIQEIAIKYSNKVGNFIICSIFIEYKPKQNADLFYIILSTSKFIMVTI